MKESGVQAPRDSARELDAAMDRYAQGFDDAFETVYGLLSVRLGAFLRRLSGSPELAEDLLQETFSRIHRARGSFGSGAAATPWAYAIARNCYIDHYRSRRSRVKETSSTGRDGEPLYPDPPASLDTDGEARVQARQVADIVNSALAAMTVARREAFILVRYEGRSIRDAAAILGTTEGAVKLRAFHAYKEIRAALTDNGVELPSAPSKERS